MPITTGYGIDNANPFAGEFDIYVLKLKVTSYSTTTTAINYFTAQLRKANGAGAAVNVGSAISMQNNSQYAYVAQNTAVGAIIEATNEIINLAFTETGTSNTYLMAAIQYRLVG